MGRADRISSRLRHDVSTAADQYERLVLVGLFEGHGRVPAAGPVHERMANVAIGIAWGFGRVGGPHHSLHEPPKPRQHPDSLRPFSSDALDFPSGQFEPDWELRGQPVAVCHDNQNVLLRLVEIEQQRCHS